MPDNYSLSTEVGTTTKVLIVDDLGGFVTSLVDTLLSRGFDVYYFGKEKKEFFYYLADKKSFIYLDNLEENSIDKIDYLFFFPKDNLDRLKQNIFLTQKFSPKLLIGSFISFPDLVSLEELSELKDINLRLVLFEDIFGPRVVEGRLAELFSKGANKETIETGLSKQKIIFPLYSETLINELLKLFFFPSSRGKIYRVRGGEINLCRFTDMLKDYLPESNFIFSEEGSPENNLPEIRSKFKDVLIVDNLGEKIEETAEWFLRKEGSPVNPCKFTTEVIEEVAEKVDLPTLSEEIRREQNEAVENVSIQDSFPIVSPEKKKVNPLFLKVILSLVLFGFLCFAFFVVPYLFSVRSAEKGVKSLSQAKLLFEKGDYDQALKYIKEGEKSLVTSQKTLLVISPFYNLVGNDNKTKMLLDTIIVSQQIEESIKSVISSFETIAIFGSDFLKGGGVDWTESQRKIKSDFSLAYQQASLAQSSLTEAEEGFSFLKKEDFFEQTKQNLQEYREKLLKAQSLSLIIPEIMGAGGRKTYLILLQNNLELRPTGGFISAFAVIGLENGKLVNFEVYDTYQTDSQLKGQIDPPLKIQEILGEKSWYFRDANFDPEFSYSANKAIWFLEKEIHVAADGVLAINLTTFQELLAIIGEVNVNDYGEKVNSDNLLQKVIKYSESTNLDGAEGKEEFLVGLTKAVFDKFKKTDSQKIVKALMAIFGLFENKEILFYSIDPQTESSVTGLGWDGNMRSFQSSAKSSSVLSDYLFINEANLGINKANYFLKRFISHEILINGQGKVQEKISLLYENQSPSDNWPAGSYKNYLRMYLPKNTKLISAEISDLLVPESRKPFDLNYQEVFEEHNKTVFGLFFEVPIKSQVKVDISYELEEKIDLTKKFNSYLLMTQKQSGSYSDDYRLTISYSPNFIPLRVIPKATISDGRLIVSQKLDKDRIFQVDLAQ